MNFQALVLALALVAVSFAFGQQGNGGVRDGSTWQNSSRTERVTVKLTPQTSGHLGVTYTDKDGNSGSTMSGTPVPGTSTLQSSPPVQVGSKRFRVEGGRVQVEGPKGWVDWSEPGFVTVVGGALSSDPTIGTLP